MGNSETAGNTGKNKEYFYDYPENRELKKQLVYGDLIRIAKASGFTRSYIDLIFDGTRVMPEGVRDITNIIIGINKQKHEQLSSIQTNTEA